VIFFAIINNGYEALGLQFAGLCFFDLVRFGACRLGFCSKLTMTST
jgi:hypothetical protein